jgi:hypothetical protein
MLKRWMVVLAWMFSVAVIWAILIPQGLSWTGLLILAGLSLMGLWAAQWITVGPTQSMAQIINETEAEPALAIAAPGPSRSGAPVSNPLSKGDTQR